MQECPCSNLQPANLVKVESTFQIGGHLWFSFDFDRWRLLLLHTCKQTISWRQVTLLQKTHSYTATLTHFSTGRGFPLWKLVRIRAMVVRVLPWKTQTGVLVFIHICWDHSSVKMCAVRCVCVTHQSHVICQYSPTNPLWYFFGRETSEAVIVQLASLLPEGWQQRFVFSSTHPGQRLPLVKHERSTHSLQRKGLHVNVKAALRLLFFLDSEVRGSFSKHWGRKRR